MLKITSICDSNLVTLKVEGKLLGPWVEELRIACSQTEAASHHTRLDLSNVTYLDVAGFDLLQELLHRGVVIAACSSFVAEYLQMEKP